MANFGIEQMETTRSLAISLIDEYFAKIILNENAFIKVETFFHTLYALQTPATLMLPKSLADLSQEVFSDVDVRGAVLDITASLSLRMSCDDFSFDFLTEALAEGLTRVSSTPDSACLIPEHLALSLAMPDDWDAKTILQANAWLVTIILIQLCFQHTECFKRIMETKTANGVNK